MKYNIEKIWEGYNNFNEYSTETKMARSIEKKYDNVLIELAKNKRPRVKKWDNQKIFETLGQEVIEGIQKEFETHVKKYFDRRQKIKNRLKDILLEHAITIETIEPREEMFKVKSISSNAYHTQGFGAKKYARTSLVPTAYMLTELGYNAEIREDNNRFELWVNVNEFEFWILSQRFYIAVEDWAVLLWRNGTNPKVYFPYLEDNIFHSSMAKRLDKNFKPEITQAW